MGSPATQQQAPPPQRPKLQVVRGRQEVPDRVLIFGVEGIGKSSWAAAAPSPVFVAAEDGTSQLDVARLPKPETWQAVLDQIEQLRVSEHDFKTVVFDTLDALEPLLWAHISKRDNKANIEDYGYGKGYVAALDEWRVFLSALERLRRERQMGTVLIAHSLIKLFKNPEGEDFDRFELKLNPKAGGLLKEWCDAVLFAHWETYADKKKKDDPRAKGLSTGARIVSTERTAAWDAKNRYGLPQTLPLSYEDYARAKASPRSALELQLSISTKVEALNDAEVTAKVTQAVKEAGNDTTKLINIDNRMTATLSARKGA